MKLLFTFAAAAFLASASYASAAEMPKDIRGVWCDRSGGIFNLVENGGCDQSDPEMKVTSRGFETAAGECTALKVTKYDVYPWGKRANPAVRKNPYGQPYRISFLCINRHAEGRLPAYLAQRWEPEKDYLVVSAEPRR
jgi:hypothetical protein